MIAVAYGAPAAPGVVLVQRVIQPGTMIVECTGCQRHWRETANRSGRFRKHWRRCPRCHGTVST